MPIATSDGSQPVTLAKTLQAGLLRQTDPGDDIGRPLGEGWHEAAVNDRKCLDLAFARHRFEHKIR